MQMYVHVVVLAKYIMEWKRNWTSLILHTQGFFVQLESKKVKKMWYIVSGKEKGYQVPKEPVEIDVDDFALLKPLYR